MRYSRAELTDPENCAPFMPVGLVVRANSAAVVPEDAPSRCTVYRAGCRLLVVAFDAHPESAPLSSTSRSGISPSHLQRLSLQRSAPPNPLRGFARVPLPSHCCFALSPVGCRLSWAVIPTTSPPTARRG